MSTNANGMLPHLWERDEVVAERVYEDIDRCIRNGLNNQETARRVGVSSRTVSRRRNRDTT